MAFSMGEGGCSDECGRVCSGRAGYPMGRRRLLAKGRRRVQIFASPKGLAILQKFYLVHREELQTVGAQIIGLLLKRAVLKANREDGS